MCGIIGYVGDDALPVLVDGLRRLEYRGYDSAGVSLGGDDLRIYRTEGEVDELAAEVEGVESSELGVGHTRWSTHGEPTERNAHPHTDCTGDVAVVHNGIVENHEELRRRLEGDGHEFTSDTDTEVVAHLLEERLDGDLREALEDVVQELEGSYALAVTASGYDGVAVARRGSPLLVGYGDGENYVASDAPAIVNRTKQVSYLEDGDVAYLTADAVTVYSDGERVERDVENIDWDAEEAEKGGYPHFMLKEIHEQPRSLRQCISGRLDEFDGEVELDLEVPEEVEHVEVVACGTSYHAGLYARRLFEDHADLRTSVEFASEYQPSADLVVAVTQSGETADTLSAVRRAKSQGARVVAVTNTVGSTVTREADDTVFIRAGPEIGVAATKTFASQVATLAMVSVEFGRRRGTLSSVAATEILSDLHDLPGAVQQVLDRSAEVAEVASELVDSESFFFVGRKLGYPVALEGALKLKEISYLHAEGFPAGELKHGPLALVTQETPVLALLTEGTLPEKTVNNVEEVEARGAPVVALTSGETEREYDAVFEIPTCGEFEPLVANVYLQLFAYHVADDLDRSIDKPRNLAKSVTVE